MKIVRKLTALLLALALTLGLSVSASAAKKELYTDTDTTAALDLLSLVQVFDGYQDGTFRGGNLLTRAQLTKVACQLLNLSVKENAVTPFADCAGHWAEDYIAAAYEAGVVNGKTASRFDPDASVTHYQTAMILARMVGYDDSATASLPWAERVQTAVKAAGLEGALTLSNEPLTRMEAANASYAALLCQKLTGSPAGISLTSNTLAGELGVYAIPGTNAQGTSTVQFSVTRSGVTKKTNAYPVNKGSSLPAATVTPVVAPSSSPTVCYGYLTGQPGIAMWQDGNTYQTLELWNGARLAEMYTTATLPAYPDHVLVRYEIASDGSVNDLRFFYLGNSSLKIGAIRDMEEGEYLVLSDGSVRMLTEDTVILYVDTAAESAEKVGYPDGGLSLAQQAADGTYTNNILYILDDDGDLACVVADVNNAITAR